jgi:hypothetical protein
VCWLPRIGAIQRRCGGGGQRGAPAARSARTNGVDARKARRNLGAPRAARWSWAGQLLAVAGTGRAPRGGKRKLLSEVRGRLESLDWRLSVLEQRVGTSPDLAQLDQQITQIRRDKQSAIDAQDFENAAVLRDRGSQLLSD